MPSGWMVTCAVLGNCKVAHEQLFFEDGMSPNNIGYFDDGTVRSDITTAGYSRTNGHYDDCVMREAVFRTPALPKYNLFCSNCQDWTAQVRFQYAILSKDPVIQEKCRCRKKGGDTESETRESSVPKVDANAATAAAAAAIGSTVLLFLLAF